MWLLRRNSVWTEALCSETWFLNDDPVLKGWVNYEYSSVSSLYLPFSPATMDLSLNSREGIGNISMTKRRGAASVDLPWGCKNINQQIQHHWYQLSWPNKKISDLGCWPLGVPLLTLVAWQKVREGEGRMVLAMWKLGGLCSSIHSFNSFFHYVVGTLNSPWILFSPSRIIEL